MNQLSLSGSPRLVIDVKAEIPDVPEVSASAEAPAPAPQKTYIEALTARLKAHASSDSGWGILLDATIKNNGDVLVGNTNLEERGATFKNPHTVELKAPSMFHNAKETSQVTVIPDWEEAKAINGKDYQRASVVLTLEDGTHVIIPREASDVVRAAMAENLTPEGNSKGLSIPVRLANGKFVNLDLESLRAAHERAFEDYVDKSSGVTSERYKAQLLVTAWQKVKEKQASNDPYKDEKDHIKQLRIKPKEVGGKKKTAMVDVAKEPKKEKVDAVDQEFTEPKAGKTLRQWIGGLWNRLKPKLELSAPEKVVPAEPEVSSKEGTAAVEGEIPAPKEDLGEKISKAWAALRAKLFPKNVEPVEDEVVVVEGDADDDSGRRSLEEDPGDGDVVQTYLKRKSPKEVQALKNPKTLTSVEAPDRIGASKLLEKYRSKHERVGPSIPDSTAGSVISPLSTPVPELAPAEREEDKGDQDETAEPIEQVETPKLSPAMGTQRQPYRKGAGVVPVERKAVTEGAAQSAEAEAEAEATEAIEDKETAEEGPDKAPVDESVVAPEGSKLDKDSVEDLLNAQKPGVDALTAEDADKMSQAHDQKLKEVIGQERQKINEAREAEQQQAVDRLEIEDAQKLIEEQAYTIVESVVAEENIEASQVETPKLSPAMGTQRQPYRKGAGVVPVERKAVTEGAAQSAEAEAEAEATETIPLPEGGAVTAQMKSVFGEFHKQKGPNGMFYQILEHQVSQNITSTLIKEGLLTEGYEIKEGHSLKEVERIVLESTALGETSPKDRYARLYTQVPQRITQDVAVAAWEQEIHNQQLELRVLETIVFLKNHPEVNALYDTDTEVRRSVDLLGDRLFRLRIYEELNAKNRAIYNAGYLQFVQDVALELIALNEKLPDQAKFSVDPNNYQPSATHLSKQQKESIDKLEADEAKQEAYEHAIRLQELSTVTGEVNVAESLENKGEAEVQETPEDKEQLAPAEEEPQEPAPETTQPVALEATEAIADKETAEEGPDKAPVDESVVAPEGSKKTGFWGRIVGWVGKLTGRKDPKTVQRRLTGSEVASVESEEPKVELENLRKTLRDNAERLRNILHEEKEARDGEVVTLPNLPTIVIRDIHARPDVIPKILANYMGGQAEGKNLTRPQLVEKAKQLISEGKLAVVFLGDYAHTEAPDNWLEIQSYDPSIREEGMKKELTAYNTVIEELLELKQLAKGSGNPNMVTIIRGNHDKSDLTGGHRIGKKYSDNVIIELTDNWSRCLGGVDSDLFEKICRLESDMPLMAVRDEDRTVFAHDVPSPKVDLKSLKTTKLSVNDLDTLEKIYFTDVTRTSPIDKVLLNNSLINLSNALFEGKKPITLYVGHNPDNLSYELDYGKIHLGDFRLGSGFEPAFLDAAVVAEEVHGEDQETEVKGSVLSEESPEWDEGTGEGENDNLGEEPASLEKARAEEAVVAEEVSDGEALVEEKKIVEKMILEKAKEMSVDLENKLGEQYDAWMACMLEKIKEFDSIQEHKKLQIYLNLFEFDNISGLQLRFNKYRFEPWDGVQKFIENGESFGEKDVVSEERRQYIKDVLVSSMIFIIKREDFDSEKTTEDPCKIDSDESIHLSDLPFPQMHSRFTKSKDTYMTLKLEDGSFVFSGKEGEIVKIINLSNGETFEKSIPVLEMLKADEFSDQQFYFSVQGRNDIGHYVIRVPSYYKPDNIDSNFVHISRISDARAAQLKKGLETGGVDSGQGIETGVSDTPAAESNEPAVPQTAEVEEAVAEEAPIAEEISAQEEPVEVEEAEPITSEPAVVAETTEAEFAEEASEVISDATEDVEEVQSSAEDAGEDQEVAKEMILNKAKEMGVNLKTKLGYQYDAWMAYMLEKVKEFDGIQVEKLKDYFEWRFKFNGISNNDFQLSTTYRLDRWKEVTSFINDEEKIEITEEEKEKFKDIVISAMISIIEKQYFDSEESSKQPISLTTTHKIYFGDSPFPQRNASNLKSKNKPSLVLEFQDGKFVFSDETVEITNLNNGKSSSISIYVKIDSEAEQEFVFSVEGNNGTEYYRIKIPSDYSPYNSNQNDMILISRISDTRAEELKARARGEEVAIVVEETESTTAITDSPDGKEAEETTILGSDEPLSEAVETKKSARLYTLSEMYRLKKAIKYLDANREHFDLAYLLARIPEPLKDDLIKQGILITGTEDKTSLAEGKYDDLLASMKTFWEEARLSHFENLKNLHGSDASLYETNLDMVFNQLTSGSDKLNSEQNSGDLDMATVSIVDTVMSTDIAEQLRTFQFAGKYFAEDQSLDKLQEMYPGIENPDFELREKIMKDLVKFVIEAVKS